MMRHATAKELSAYVDRHLSARVAGRLESHLEGCSSCRQRLAGLRQVVGTLRRLERRSPPPVLAQHVARRVALEPQRRSPLQHLEGWLERLAPPSHLLVSFALIIALAVIVYLFAHGLEQVQRRGTSVVIPPSGTGQEAGPGSEQPVTLDDVDRLLVISDRIFERRGRTWWEEDLSPETPRRVSPADAVGRRILRRYPELEGVLEQGDSLVMRFEGEVVELAGADEPPTRPLRR